MKLWLIQVHGWILLHGRVRRPADQDQQNIEDIPGGEAQRQETVLHIAPFPANHLLDPGVLPDPDKRRVDGHRSCQGNASLPDPRGQSAGLQQLHRRQLHDSLHLPDHSDNCLHRLRCFNQENTRGLQREQAHR